MQCTVQDSSRLSQMQTDASADGFGAALSQPRLDDSVRPINCIICVTLRNETYWDPLELEGGVITRGMKQFRKYFFHAPFHVYTNYGLFEQLAKIGEYHPRVQRWLNFLTAHQYTIEHRPGMSNENADRLAQTQTASDFSPAY